MPDGRDTGVSHGCEGYGCAVKNFYDDSYRMVCRTERQDSLQD